MWAISREGCEVDMLPTADAHYYIVAEQSKENAPDLRSKPEFGCMHGE